MVQTAPSTLITSFSIEGFFFGVNGILIKFCVYTFWGQKATSCRLLLLINTVQFLICLTQIILDTMFYFRVFTVYNGNIMRYFTYVNVFNVGSVVIFNVTFVIAGLLSIWRLYVLYGSDIRVCIPVLVIWVAQICASALTIHSYTIIPVAVMGFEPITMLLWALIATLNLCVAIPICVRLCIAQERVRTRNILSSSVYKSIAIVLIECGTLITACSVGMMILYACNFTYFIITTGLATQVAIASQLLITARHGLLTQGSSISSSSSALSKVNVIRTEPQPIGRSANHTKTKSSSSSTEPASQELQHDRKACLDVV